MLRIDGIDFLKDDITLENGFAVFDDIGHGKASVYTAADLPCDQGIARGFCISACNFVGGFAETLKYCEAYSGQAKCERRQHATIKEPELGAGIFFQDTVLSTDAQRVASVPVQRKA